MAHRAEVIEFLRDEVQRRDSRQTFLWTVVASALAGVIVLGRWSYGILDGLATEQLLLFSFLSLLVAGTFALPLAERLVEILHPTMLKTSYTATDAHLIDRCYGNLGYPAFTRWYAALQTLVALATAILGVLFLRTLARDSFVEVVVASATAAVVVFSAIVVLSGLVRMLQTGKLAAAASATMWHMASQAVPELREYLKLDQLTSKRYSQDLPALGQEDAKFTVGNTMKATEVVRAFARIVLVAVLTWALWEASKTGPIQLLLDLAAVSMMTGLGAILIAVAMDLYFDRSREWVGQLHLDHLQTEPDSNPAEVLMKFRIIEHARYQGLHYRKSWEDFWEAVSPLPDMVVAANTPTSQSTPTPSSEA